MPKKNKINPYLEAKVLVENNGVIDLKKLWKEEEDKELDPKEVAKLAPT